MTARRAALSVATAAVALGALAGCSADDDGTPTAPASTTPGSTAPSAAPGSTGVPRSTVSVSPGTLTPQVPAPSSGLPVPIPSDGTTTR